MSAEDPVISEEGILGALKAAMEGDIAGMAEHLEGPLVKTMMEILPRYRRMLNALADAIGNKSFGIASLVFSALVAELQMDGQAMTAYAVGVGAVPHAPEEREAWLMGMQETMTDLMERYDVAPRDIHGL